MPAFAQERDPDAEDGTAQDAVNLDKVTVAATRYSAADMQMAASNTASVLSAEDLRYTAVHNIAEALGLMPGVNVINTGQSYFGGIDGAARGEGMFASVRGLNAEYNVNLINGVTVAQGMPYSRAVQLRLLPPSGLQTIVLNKTSTAAMDGDAIGGTIDYRTPTAFDYGAQSGGSVSLSGRVESRARDYGDSGLGGGVAGDWHGRFGGDRQFGVYASGYYDTRDYVNSQYAGATAAGSDGTWEFSRTDADGNLADGYDPQRALMGTGLYAGYSQGDTRRFGGNVSFDWRVDPTLLVYARGTFARAFTEQNTGYSQLIPRNVGYAQTGVDGVYQPIIGGYAVRYWYETNPEMADLATLQFGADKHWGNWTISPNVFYGFGHNDRPDHLEISARTDQYADRGGTFAYGAGQLLSQDADGYPIPQLTPEMAAAIDDIGGLYVRRAGQLTRQYSGQKKGGAKLDLRRVFDQGALQELQFGLKHTTSSREFTSRNWTTGYYGGYATLDDTGLVDGRYDAVFPGKYDWSTVHLSNDALTTLINERLTESSFDTCGSLYVNNWNCNTMRGTESVSSAYAMATLRYGDLEIIPGLRYEHTRIRNTYWARQPNQDGAEVTGHFENNHTRYGVALPSVFVNWRPGAGDSVYRAGLWTSYTRPAFVQLGGGSTTSISADTGRITITEGNPDLDPIKSLNLDLSGEWRNDRGGHAMLAGYYKRLSNYIYESGSNAVNRGESSEGDTIYRRPRNGGDGEVLGVEVALRQRFQDLPALLDGFGVGLNATRQKTRVDLGMDGFERERIQNAPDLLANAELFYENGPLSVNLSWHYSGQYVAVYDYLRQGENWDHLWVEPVQRVDLHVGYAVGERWRADLSIANLTKRESYRARVGRDSMALQDIVDAGMTGLLTLRYAF
ncbi:MAG: TonB-dependent receptor [Pseudomonas sp.]